MHEYLKFIEDIKNQKTIVLSSLDKDGYPVNRAMLVVKRSFCINKMYFSTNTSSSKITEFENDSRASVFYYNDSNFKGVNLRGKITIMQDQETKDHFWHDGDEQYYHLGKTDPDYTILKFEPEMGSYYSGGITTKFKLIVKE